MIIFILWAVQVHSEDQRSWVDPAVQPLAWPMMQRHSWPVWPKTNDPVAGSDSIRNKQTSRKLTQGMRLCWLMTKLKSSRVWLSPFLQWIDSRACLTLGGLIINHYWYLALAVSIYFMGWEAKQCSRSLKGWGLSGLCYTSSPHSLHGKMQGNNGPVQFGGHFLRGQYFVSWVV